MNERNTIITSPQSTSSFVEGLGDEVVYFFLTILMIFLGTIAWFWSSPRPQTSNQISDLLNRLHGIITNYTEEEETHENNERSESNRENQSQNNRQNNQDDDDSDTSDPDEPKVKIKLKFIDDTIREVESSLSEKIDRFIRRHFADELSRNKNIKVIFNGRALNRNQKLRECGLFENCVVHCLVLNNNSNSQSNQLNGNVQIDEDNLDLSHLCYPLLGSFLVVLWWCQFVYSHYFSNTSTISLIALTLVYIASITNTYLY